MQQTETNSSSLAMSNLCCAAAAMAFDGVSILAAAPPAAGDVLRTSHASEVGLWGGGVFS